MPEVNPNEKKSRLKEVLIDCIYFEMYAVNSPLKLTIGLKEALICQTSAGTFSKSDTIKTLNAVLTFVFDFFLYLLDSVGS